MCVHPSTARGGFGFVKLQLLRAGFVTRIRGTRAGWEGATVALSIRSLFRRHCRRRDRAHLACPAWSGLISRSPGLGGDFAESLTAMQMREGAHFPRGSAARATYHPRSNNEAVQTSRHPTFSCALSINSLASRTFSQALLIIACPFALRIWSEPIARF